MDNKILKFIIYGVISEFLYLSFFIINSLKDNFNDINISLNNDFLWVAVVCILFILLLLYLKSYKIISEKNISIKLIILFAVLFNITLVFIWPVGSSDFISYINRSRIVSRYNDNPYIIPYDSYPDDELYPSLRTSLSKNTTIYGPLFTSSGSVLTYLAGDNFLLNVYLFKSVFVIFNILIIFIIYKLTGNKNAVFLYSWNPFILFELALNAHNEVVLILLILLSLYYFFRKSSIKNLLFGWLLLVLSVLIKFFSLMFLPFYLIFAINNLKRNREKIIFFVSACLLGLFLVVLLYLPYWEGFEIFGQLKAIATKESMYSSFGIIILSYLLMKTGVGNWYWWSKTINKSLFVFVYFLLLFQLLFIEKTYTKNNLLKYFIITFGLFLIMFFTWLMPWYLTTLIALIALYIGLTKKYKMDLYIYALTAYGIIFYLILR